MINTIKKTNNTIRTIKQNSRSMYPIRQLQPGESFFAPTYRKNLVECIRGLRYRSNLKSAAKFIVVNEINTEGKRKQHGVRCTRVNHNLQLS